jgi:hypothetical protein
MGAPYHQRFRRRRKSEIRMISFRSVIIAFPFLRLGKIEEG